MENLEGLRSNILNGDVQAEELEHVLKSLTISRVKGKMLSYLYFDRLDS